MNKNKMDQRKKMMKPNEQSAEINQQNDQNRDQDDNMQQRPQMQNNQQQRPQMQNNKPQQKKPQTSQKQNSEMYSMIAKGQNYQKDKKEQVMDEKQIQRQLNGICMRKATLHRKLEIFGIDREEDFVFYDICYKQKEKAKKCMTGNKMKRSIDNLMRRKPRALVFKRLKLIDVKRITPKDLKLNVPVDWETLAFNLNEKLLNW